MPRNVVKVPGGYIILTDIFSNENWEAYTFNSKLAIADPPYGDNIVTDLWDKITAKELAKELKLFGTRLQNYMPAGSQFFIWGGFGTPEERALFRTILELEDFTNWKLASFITWKKKRAYGTKWRCLAAREELCRFVLGDIKKPLVFNVQYTEDERGYEGFNPAHPAKSKFKRLTMVWDHASDMGQNKPHKCHKPEPLARTMIEMCSNQGDVILDFFAGSAQVSLTARELGRPFVAFENCNYQFDKIVEVLS